MEEATFQVNMIVLVSSVRLLDFQKWRGCIYKGSKGVGYQSPNINATAFNLHGHWDRIVYLVHSF